MTATLISLHALSTPINLNCRDQTTSITPCIADIRQDQRDLFVTQGLCKWRHPVGARIGCGNGRIASMENAAYRIDRGSQRHTPVARERRINIWRALPQTPVAILTMCLVDFAALPQLSIDFRGKLRRYSPGIRRALGQGLQIGSHGAGIILRQMLQALTDDIRHWSGCHCTGGKAGLEYLRDILDRPVGGAGFLEGSQRGRIPVRTHDLASSQSIALACAKGIAAGMAGVAMPKSLHEVGAAIPFIAPAGISFVNALGKVKGAPEIQERTEVEGKTDQVWRIALLDGWQRLQIGEDSIGILARDFRVVGVWKCRVQKASIAGLAMVHCAPEVLFIPEPDTSFLIGVIFGVMKVPIDVARMCPPAYGCPFCAVWQPMQLPACAR